ncbi:MAG: hypothetical protein IKS44_01765, partial [Bacteroidales bacterium]|nr:hypothetical protein [Bacteroidales bacterium]
MKRPAHPHWALLPLLLIAAKPAIATPPTTCNPPEGEAPTVVTTLLDTVDPDDGVVSLREALRHVVASGSAATVTFSLSQSAPVIHLTDTLPAVVNAVCTINGRNHGPGGGIVTIVGSGTRKLFTARNATLTLDSLNLTGGYALGPGGALLCYQTILTLRHCTISGCQATHSGGAVYCGSDPPNLSRVTITDCLFTGNRSLNGGALCLSGCDTSFIVRTRFRGNTVATRAHAHCYGGAVKIETSLCRLDSCLFADNHASLRDTDIILSAKSNGGALSANASRVTVSNTLFDTNSACAATSGSAMGGSVYTNNSTLHIVNCLFRADSADGKGGAIYSTGADTSLRVTLSQSTFVGNYARVGLGGAFCQEGQTRHITNNCTFYNNQTDMGGALFFHNTSGTSTILNSTFVGNIGAPALGGAVCIRGGDVQVVNNLFVGNLGGTVPDDLSIRAVATAVAYNNAWAATPANLDNAEGNTLVTLPQLHTDANGLPLSAVVEVNGVPHTLFPPLPASVSAIGGIRTAHNAVLSATARLSPTGWRDNRTGSLLTYTPVPDSLDQIGSLRRLDSTSIGAIQPMPDILITDTVTACDSYTWRGDTITLSGDYRDTVHSVILWDSIYSLHATIHQGTRQSYSHHACEQYTWHDVNYTQSGTYTYNYTNNAGCPSTDSLHLSISQHDDTSYHVTACDEFTWNGTSYANSGTYTFDHTQQDTPCTNVETLHLTINNSTHNSYHQDACEQYTWHDVNYTESGTYTYDYTNSYGCASTDTLHLTIARHDDSTYYLTACDEYIWNGTTYTTTGTYTFYHTQPNSPCTNVDTLHLTINNSTHNSYLQDACEQFSWHEITYNESGTYTYNYTNTDGCPSTDTLILTISQHDDTTYYVTACDEYTWNGTTYTTTGTYTFDNTQQGTPCTNIDTLHLTINNSTHNSYHQDACEQYTWHEITYNESGLYTYEYSNDDNCPSADT